MAHAPHEINVTLDPVLTYMWKAQAVLQSRILGMHPSELDDPAKMAYIREQALALVTEVVEALNETGWKSWATSNHINRSAYVSELCADAMRFLMNMTLAAGVTAHEFAEVWLRKSDRVMARATQGYDGVSTKCPGCKRDVNDAGVQCAVDTGPDGNKYQWCARRQAYFDADGNEIGFSTGSSLLNHTYAGKWGSGLPCVWLGMTGPCGEPERRHYDRAGLRPNERLAE